MRLRICIALAILGLCLSSSAQITKSGLPPGLTLSASGLIAGTPTTEGIYAFNVVACDSETPAQCSAPTPFTLTIYGAIVITTTSPLPTGITGKAYSVQLQGSGGSGNLTYSVQ